MPFFMSAGVAHTNDIVGSRANPGRRKAANKGARLVAAGETQKTRQKIRAAVALSASTDSLANKAGLEATAS